MAKSANNDGSAFFGISLKRMLGLTNLYAKHYAKNYASPIF